MNTIYKFLKKHRYTVMGIILAILVILLIFTVRHFYFNEDNTVNADILPSDSHASASISFEGKDVLSGDSTFLVVCTGDSDREIMFISLLDFKIYSENIIVTPLSERTVYNGKTYSEIYSYGGIDALVEAVENVRHGAVDRYAVLSRKGFISLVDNLGKVTEYVEEDYTYQSSDKSYEVEMGDNELEGAMLYTYIKINAEKSDGLDRMASIFCDMINTYLKTLKDEDTLELFGDVCNCLNTNVTVADYYSAEKDIAYILSHNTVCISDYGVNR